MAIAYDVEVEVAPPWLSLPLLGGVNVYWSPPSGPIVAPAIVYRPDQPWIERQATYKVWRELYVAVCVVPASSGPDGVAKLYEMALTLKAALDAPDAPAGWDWLGVGGIVEVDQAGLRYLAAAVRLSFNAEYDT